MVSQQTTSQEYRPFDEIGQLVELHRAVLGYIEQIQNYVREHVPDGNADDFDEVLQTLKTDGFGVAVVGRMRTGKSTFLNAFCGQYISPVSVNNCTVAPIKIHYGTHRRAEVWFFPKEDHPLASIADGAGGLSQVAREQERTERLTARLIPLLRGGAHRLIGRKSRRGKKSKASSAKHDGASGSPATASNASQRPNVLVSKEIPFEDLKYYVDYNYNDKNEKCVAFVDVAVDGSLFKKGLILIDSCGIGGLNESIEQPMMRGLLPSVDAALLVYSSKGNLGRQEMNYLLKEVRIKARQGKVFIVQNCHRDRWDTDSVFREKMERVRQKTAADILREYEIQRTDQDPESFEVEILQVDSAQAWKGVEDHRQELVVDSGLPAVQSAVECYLQHEFGQRRLQGVRRKLMDDLSAIRADALRELGLLDQRKGDVQDIKNEFDAFVDSMMEDKDWQREAAATAIKQLVARARKEFLSYMREICRRKKKSLNSWTFCEINAEINQDLQNAVEIWSARHVTEPGAPYQHRIRKVFESVERPLRNRIEKEFARINDRLALPVETIAPSTWSPNTQTLPVPELDVEVSLLRRWFDFIPGVEDSIDTLKNEIDKALLQIEQAASVWSRELETALSRSCRDSIDRLYRQRLVVTRRVFIRVAEHLKKTGTELEREKKAVEVRVSRLDEFLAQLDQLAERINTVTVGS